MKAALFGIALSVTALASPAGADADTPYGNFQLQIQNRYDFHTWLWSISHCASDRDCVQIQAIPQPVARAFTYKGDAFLTSGRYTLAVDVPDGLRCGNIYYGPIVPTRDVYSWDAVTRSGTLESSFETGCDGAPGGTLTYPFTLVRL